MVNDIQTGFARADDGVELYWRSVGRGPAMVCCNGVGVSTFFWKYLIEHFRDRYTVIVWDYRGHGRSSRSLDPATADLSVPRHAADLDAVLQAALPNREPTIVIGHSMGCQVSLEYRRLAPHRVRALILMLGTAGRALDTFFDWSGSAAVFRRLHQLVFSMGPAVNDLIRPVLNSPLSWPVARALYLIDPMYARREDVLAYTRHLASIDVRVFLESALRLNEHDAWSLLPELDRPVLIIAAERDTFTPMWCSREMVQLTPGAELLVLADASHAALIEQPETIHHRIERFLVERLTSSSGQGDASEHVARSRL